MSNGMLPSLWKYRISNSLNETGRPKWKLRDTAIKRGATSWLAEHIGKQRWAGIRIELLQVFFNLTIVNVRWVLLAAHCLSFIGSCMCQVAFVPIATNVSTLFEVNVIMVTMCSLVFSISFIPFNFVAIKILGSTWGGLRVCVILNL